MADGGVTIYTDQGGDVLQTLARVNQQARNETEATLASGTPVYVVDFDDAHGLPLVAPASASNHAHFPILGLSAEPILPASNGEIAVSGEIRGVNTSGFALNAELYIAEGGGLTDSVPASPALGVKVAIVTRVHATEGRIVVYPNPVLAATGAVPLGGAAGQSLRKLSNIDQDAAWVDDHDIVFLVDAQATLTVDISTLSVPLVTYRSTANSFSADRTITLTGTPQQSQRIRVIHLGGEAFTWTIAGLGTAGAISFVLNHNRWVEFGIANNGNIDWIAGGPASQNTINGLGLPTGGNVGQVLTKSGIDNFVAEWQDPTGAGSTTTWHSGSGSPSDEFTTDFGEDGDFYLDTSGADIYEKVAGTWTLRLNIAGPQGPQGEQGQNFTVDASGTLAGRSAFDNEAEGFAYLSTDGDGALIETAVIFIREGATAGVWSDPIPFQGPEGPVGATGPEGPVGPQGDPGQNFNVNASGTFAGRSAFDNEAEGFSYLSTDGDGALIETAVIFVRETATAGVWSDPIPFQGPAGPEGPAGPQGDPGQNFNVNATGTFAGRAAFDGEAEGFSYLSTDGDGALIETAVIFIREGATAGVWSDPIPFQGPEGPTGPQGDPGPQGNTGPGVPSGGAAGSVLTKVSGTDFNTFWSDFLKAFTNRLELVATVGNESRIEMRTSGVPATDFLQIGAFPDGGGAALRSFRTTGAVVLDFNPQPLDGTSGAIARLFRETNTTGSVRLRFHRGDGTIGHVADLRVNPTDDRLDVDGSLQFEGTFAKPVIVRGVRLWADDLGQLRFRDALDPVAHDDGALIGSGGHIFDLDGTPESIGDLDGRFAVWSAVENGLNGGPLPGPLVEIAEVDFQHLAQPVVDAINAGGAIPAAVTVATPTHSLLYGAGGGDDQRAHRNVLLVAADATALVVPKAAPVGSTWFVDLATGNTVTVAVEDNAGSVNGNAQGSVTAEHLGGTIAIWVRSNLGIAPVVRVSGDTTEVTQLGADIDANGHVIFGNRHRIYRGLSGVQTLSAANFSAGSELLNTGAAATYTVPARVTVADEAEALVVDNTDGSGDLTLSADGVTFEGGGGTTVPMGETRALTWSSNGTTHFCRVR